MTTTEAADHWVDHWMVFADGCQWLAPMSEDQHRAWHDEGKRTTAEHLAKSSDPSCGFSFFHTPDDGSDDGPYTVDWPATIAANMGRPVDFLTDADLEAWAIADPDAFRADRTVSEAEAVTIAATIANDARPRARLRKTTKRG